MPCQCTCACPCDSCGGALPPIRNRPRFCSTACATTGVRRETLAQHEAVFWSRTNRSGDCWLWTAGHDKDGYGKAWYGGQTLRAHRMAFFLTRGYWPVLACHTCDTPACCRPEHIFDGTHATNHADRNAKRRQARGERQGTAKLTRALVTEMRALYAAGGITHKELSARFRVSMGTVSNVTTGKYWRE